MGESRADQSNDDIGRHVDAQPVLCRQAWSPIESWRRSRLTEIDYDGDDKGDE